jgi:hypothetical protein
LPPPAPAPSPAGRNPASPPQGHSRAAAGRPRAGGLRRVRLSARAGTAGRGRRQAGMQAGRQAGRQATNRKASGW